MTLDELLLEWSYRSERGYPSTDNPSDVFVLKEILRELKLPEGEIDELVDDLEEKDNLAVPGTDGMDSDSPVEKEKEKQAQKIKKSQQTTPISSDNDEISSLRTQLGSHKKSDLINLIKKIDLDEKQIQKMYQRISNFASYAPILKSLRASNYKESEVKRYSSEIQSLLEPLNPTEVTQFVDYLSNPENQIEFPLKSEGNLFSIMPSDNVPAPVMDKIISHTTQDEGKRGVGMGEMGMALVFKNITDSRGKGDLALNGEEFEVKGNGATLGEKPDMFPVDMLKLEPFGLRKVGRTYEIGEGENISIVSRLNKFTEALSITYNKTDRKEEFKNALKETLTNDVGHGEAVNALFNKIDLNNPENIQREIALMNLYRYVNKEQFRHFLAHDFGKMGGGNTGKYVYAGGSPEDIINGIRGLATFEKISWNNCRPRIGFANTYLEEEA